VVFANVGEDVLFKRPAKEVELTDSRDECRRILALKFDALTPTEGVKELLVKGLEL
jgi:hypothetical protein